MSSTIIFDFDGTLVDSTDLIFLIFNQLKDEFNLKQFEHYELEELRKKSLKELISLSKISPLQLPKLIKRVQEELKQFIPELSWHSGMSELIIKLKQSGYKMGILTANSVENVNKFLQLQNFDYFEFVYSAKKIFSKEKRLKKVIKNKRLKIHEVLYVGDEVSDVEACQAVGVDIVAVDWGFDSMELLEACNPSYLASTPKQLLQKIQLKYRISQ